MAFFDDIGKKITTVGKDATKKAKDLTEITKLNMQISSEEENVRNNYTQIGKLYYEAFGDSGDDERLIPLCSSITKSLGNISAFKVRIENIKGVKRCEKCGAEVSDSSTFCSTCGQKVGSAPNNIPEADNVNKCPECGKPITAETVFCTNCGKKVND